LSSLGLLEIRNKPIEKKEMIPESSPPYVNYCHTAPDEYNLQNSIYLEEDTLSPSNRDRDRPHTISEQHRDYAYSAVDLTTTKPITYTALNTTHTTTTSTTKLLYSTNEKEKGRI
jgi:hypothetical protein